jgi:K+-transporting ATPase ATPase A chain
MSDTTAGWLEVALLVIALIAIHKPLGDWMARIFTSTHHTRLEKGVYRAIRVDPDADQRWGVYARSMLAFAAVCIVVLFGLLRLQAYLPFHNAIDNMPSYQALNTAISFVTNTNWQSYSGETGTSYLAQMLGLVIQNFVSAAVGIAIAVAVIRGFTRQKTDRLGNFWVDVTRTLLRLLLPLAFIGAVVLLLAGVIQNFTAPHTISTLAGGTQTIPGGPVASQESIKLLGNNGGGFFNANSAHPFESPTGFTNLLEIFLILVIPFSLPRTLGKMVGDVRQGYAIVAVMVILWAGAVGATVAAELQHSGTALQAAGAAMEGKEVRFGVPMSAVFGASTTLTSTGAVDSFHDSYTAFGGGMTMFDMMIGEVAPGGVGSGLYGMLVLAILAVFLAGLMVGRTPEYMGKKLQAREMKFASLYILATPSVVLIGAGIAMATQAGRAGILNPGAHGLSEVLYAFTSAANNNGSAFAGLSANTNFYNLALSVCMFLGRILPMVLVLGLAGSLAKQTPVAVTSGTLPTHRLQFVLLLVGVVIIVAGLTFVPALALGPLAEGLS